MLPLSLTYKYNQVWIGSIELILAKERKRREEGEKIDWVEAEVAYKKHGSVGKLFDNNTMLVKNQ